MRPFIAPPTGGYGKENGGAFVFLLDGLLDGLDLAPDAAHPVEQFLLVSDGVGHRRSPVR
jgi:hypothetical protein